MLTWWFARKAGRHGIIIFGCALCNVCHLVMAALYTSPSLSIRSKGIGLVVIKNVCLFGFNFCLEPYVYLVASEMPSQKPRGYTMGIAAATSFAFAWLCEFTTPYFINPAELNWNPKFGYIWFASGLTLTAFVYFMLPEVKSQTVEEIDEMFRSKMYLRSFGKYVCVEIEEARERGVMNARAMEKLDEYKPAETHVENSKA